MAATTYLLLTILLAASATFITRALPFVLLKRVADHPLLIFLGRFLPPMLMVLLLLYSIKNENFLSRGFLPELISLSAVFILHVLLRNPLVSILGGTALFMSISQSGLFPG